MTTAYERTKSVIETREFLRLLASSDDDVTRARIRLVAARLLRHYPLDIDLELAAAALPGVWAVPLCRRHG
ncbi:hypothetical protein X992_5487 [Burkholderia pseudomallei MSHR5492]|nr:BPSL0761 family protein [Burkholderia pseudomallei]KGS38296.1 hypothetical protein X992_5487 [Burkholderia pseudomallei MSHR5492]